MKRFAILNKFDKPASNINDLGLLLLRLSVGVVMLMEHGLPKMKNFTYLSQNFPDPIGVGSYLSVSLAIFSELFCSIFLIVGLFTRFNALMLFVTMAVAFFIQHGGDPFKAKELAFLYGVIYLVLIFTGPGKYAVDKRIK